MRFSIIIPVRKPLWFRLTLLSVINQSFPRSEYELIVVDNCGGGVIPVLNELEENLSQHKFKYVRSDPGRSNARNVGIDQVEGDIVLFLDDDMLASYRLIEAHNKYHENGFSVVMRGKSHHCLSIWYPDWFNNVSFQQRSLILKSSSTELLKYIEYVPEDPTDKEIPIINRQDIEGELEKVHALSVTEPSILESMFGDDLSNCYVPWAYGGAGNLSVWRNSLEKSGRFDERFDGWGLEDYDLQFRLYRNGERFAFGNNAVAFHQFHPRDWIKNYRSSLENYKYFCSKYSSPTLYLFLTHKLTNKLTLTEYNDFAMREQRGELTDLDISFAEQEYRNFLSLDEDALQRIAINTAERSLGQADTRR